MNKDLLLPYYTDKDYLCCIPENSILQTRFKKDYQSDCFLFKECIEQAIDEEEAKYLSSQFQLCYIYDMFNFENKEFTIDGYEAINDDIKKIISCGFKYILVSNPYIIELICNEYAKDINIIISSQLEINSVQSKIFFDVLNNTSNISHIILAQNYQCKEELKSIKEKFQNFNLVLEADRFTSKNQIVYEAYYNMLYGYHNDYTRKYIGTFLNENKKFAKLPVDLIEKELDFSYKFGTMNTDVKLLVSNIKYYIKEEFDKIEIVDYYLWT